MRREQSGTCIHGASWSHIHIAVTAVVHSAVIHLDLADVWSLNMNGEGSNALIKGQFGGNVSCYYLLA